MKHCNFRFDENKGEWLQKTDQFQTDKIDDKVSGAEVEEDGLFELEL